MKVKKELSLDNGIIKISLTADKYVRSLQLYSRTNSSPFSDNYFDLLPGETKIITRKATDGVSVEELKNDITVFSLCDVVPKNSKLADVLQQVKILSIDSNYKSYLQQRKIPQDLKIND